MSNITKKKNRDDFIDETKRIAADRVNSLCSICFQLTKAASAEGNDKVSNMGVAAHICAAAPGIGARRYDPKMTSEERKSIENCIWLCQDHAKLIDTDEVTFSKEYLIEKKKKAEERAAKALVNKESKILVMNGAGFGIEKTMQILQEKVANGDFFELNELLNSMDISEDNINTSDLHDYFKLVYSFYCERDGIESKIEEYKKRSTKNYINQLCELFAQYFEVDYLSKIVDHCTNENTKKIVAYVVNGTVEGEVITLRTEHIKDEELQKVKLILKGSFLHKLASNFAMENGINSIQNSDGSDIGLYSDEFVFKQKKLILELSIKALKNLNLKEKQLNIFEEYKAILENLDKLKMLDSAFQIFIFARLLLIASNINDFKAFENLYSECCIKIRENITIKEIVLYERINKEVSKVEFKEVRKLCETIGKYELCNTYFNKLMEVDPIDADRLINAHQFLFSVSSMFLKTNIRLKKEVRKSAKFCVISFLDSYKEEYKNDVEFHILMAFYINAKKNKAIFEKEVNWLEKNVNYAKANENALNNLSMLISVYQKADRYSKILELDGFNPPNYFRLLVASVLQNSKKQENMMQAKRIYMEVQEQEPSMEGLCRSISGCCYSIGDIQKAKEYIVKEIKLTANKEDYLNLLQLRYETNDIAIDEFIEKAKEFKDSKLDHLIGGFYLENKLPKEAKQFLLRSLLVDDTNSYCMNGYMSAVMQEEKFNQPQKAGTGITVQLRDDNGKNVMVSIHEETFFPPSGANRFAQCVHHKEKDKAAEDLLFTKIGDEIIYKGKNYKVEVLNWNEIIFNAFIMAQLIKNKRVTAIQGESTEQAIENLTKILRDQNKYNADVIKKFNDSEIAWPTSFLIKYIGRDYLSTYCFLFYENSKKFRNLNSVLKLPDSPQFILSFETIYALAILDISEEIVKTLNCLVPISVKRTMAKEVDELISQNKNDKAVGQAVLINDKIALDVPNIERRKASLKFLNKIKRLLEEMPTAGIQYSYTHDNEIKKILAEQKMFMESDTLGCVQSESNRVLVGDDPFLASIVLCDKTNAIGLNRFLALLGLDVLQHLDCIKQLARMNFGNYFTIDVYEHLKKKIVEEKDKVLQGKHIEEIVKFYTSEFIDPIKQPDLWKHNNLTIYEIGRNKKLHIVSECDEFDRLLQRAVVYNFSKEHPEEFKKRQEEIAKRFRSKLVEEDGKFYIQTWLEPD